MIARMLKITRARRTAGRWRAALLRFVFCAALLLTGAPWPAGAASDIGVATKVIKEVIAKSLNKRLGSGDGLAFNETVRTGLDSAIEILLTDDSRLTLGEDAEIILDSLVYEPNQGIVRGSFQVLSGVLRMKTAGVKMDMVIETPSATIGIRGTEFDLLTDDDATEIAMYDGTVQVTSDAGTVAVTRGQTYRVSGGSGGFLTTPTVELKQAATRMRALVAGAGNQAPANTQTRTAATSQSAATSQPGQAADTQNAGDNRLMMEMESGPVIIELRPDLAPRHVERIRALIKKGAFDGLAFSFVKPGYVAETAAPPGTDDVTIPAEFSATPFGRGAVGMSRKAKDMASATGQFFIALGRARKLDGKYTVWGRVVSGMEHLEKLKPTRGTDRREKIKTLRVAE